MKQIHRQWNSLLDQQKLDEVEHLIQYHQINVHDLTDMSQTILVLKYYIQLSNLSLCDTLLCELFVSSKLKKRHLYLMLEYLISTQQLNVGFDLCERYLNSDRDFFGQGNLSFFNFAALSLAKSFTPTFSPFSP